MRLARYLDTVRDRVKRGHRSAAPRGQSLVEFALVLPMLLVLLLGIADFGRVMSQGIVLEAAVRNGAEAAAQELVQLERNKPAGLGADDYARLHEIALEAVCEEAGVLPNQAASGDICSIPYVAVCVHDDAQGDIANCGGEATSAPSECTVMDETPWNPEATQASTAQPLSYVEVRGCYRFTTLFDLTDLDLPFGWSLSLGEVWLQRDRAFVAGNY
jgi:TadE-like protein